QFDLPTFAIARFRRAVALKALGVSWMEARVTKVARVSARFSKSLARRRLRSNQEKVRSTTQRRGKTTKPLMSSLRLTISRRSRGISPSRDHCQPPDQPACRPPLRCSRFTSMERQFSTLSRPNPLGRPDPTPPHLPYPSVNREFVGPFSFAGESVGRLNGFVGIVTDERFGVGAGFADEAMHEASGFLYMPITEPQKLRLAD